MLYSVVLLFLRLDFVIELTALTRDMEADIRGNFVHNILNELWTTIMLMRTNARGREDFVRR